MIPPGSPLRILIVGDEALLVMELKGLLAEVGHEVVGWATSATEAVELAAMQRADVAFVDLQLSDGDGAALAARIRRVADSVVFITANQRILPDDMGGALGVIAKPYSAHGMLSVLQYLHEGLRAPPPSSLRPSSFSLSPSYRTSWRNG